MKYAISACLMGDNCKYSGGNNANQTLINFMQNKEYIKVCPEMLGGLVSPRPCVELQGLKAITVDGNDVSVAFEKGAQIALDQILYESIDLVITQSRSPSCGKGMIYDGTFRGKLLEGNGLFVDKLLEKGVNVQDIVEFLDNLND